MSPPPQLPRALVAAGGGAYRPLATAPCRTEDVRAPYALPRCLPTLTIYPGGLGNLNTEASALLTLSAEAICLQAPEPVRAGRTPNPWQIGAGDCHRLVLVSADKKAGSRRFRAPAGQCPPEGRYLLTPIAGQPTRFMLVPA